MINNSFSLKTLNWDNLLKAESQASCESDETFCDRMDIEDIRDENSLQHCEQNMKQATQIGNHNHHNKNDSQPIVQEILPLNYIQNVESDKKCEQTFNSNLELIQEHSKLSFEVNDKISCFESSFEFSNTIHCENDRTQDKRKTHCYESDFSFTEDSHNEKVQNLHFDNTNDFFYSSIFPTGSPNRKRREYSLDTYLFKENLNQFDKPFEMTKMNSQVFRKLVEDNDTREGESNTNLQSEIIDNFEEQEFLENISQGLEHITRQDFVDEFFQNNINSATKQCSPPLTLRKYDHRRVKPADKVLPNYRKKKPPAEKKILPNRKCLSAYIDVCNRRLEGSSGPEETVESTKVSSSTNDSEDGGIVIQPENKRKYNKKTFRNEPSSDKTGGKDKGFYSNKTVSKVRKRSRRVRRCLFTKVKREKENSSENASQERQEKKGIIETVEEVERALEETEQRVARWVSGADHSPPTREYAFKMLADTQGYTVQLQQLKDRNNECRRKFLRKKELKLLNLFLERSHRLEITIDKAIAEADRLMSMELNEISQDSVEAVHENFDKENMKDNKYLKPILKNTSSEQSTEEGFSNKRHIYFSDKVEYRYLSSSGQSSLGCSQSFHDQKRNCMSGSQRTEIFKDNFETEICNNFCPQDSLNNSLTSGYNHQSNRFEPNELQEHEILSFQNVAIEKEQFSNQVKSVTGQPFYCYREDPPECEITPNKKHLLEQRSMSKIDIPHPITNHYRKNTEKNNAFINVAENERGNLQNNLQKVGSYCENSPKSRQKNCLLQPLSSVNSDNKPLFHNAERAHPPTRNLPTEIMYLPNETGKSCERQRPPANSDYFNSDTDSDINYQENKKTMFKTHTQATVLSSNISSQCAEAKLSPKSTQKTDESGGSTFLKLSESSTQQSETFGFSGQVSEVEQFWESVTIMSIKAIRIKEPSEYIQVTDSNGWNDFEDLEVWE